MHNRRGRIGLAALLVSAALFGVAAAPSSRSSGSIVAARRPRPTTTTTLQATTTSLLATTSVNATTTATSPSSTSSSTTTSTTVVRSTTTAAAVKCVVRLHGKGGAGFGTYNAGSWLEVGPNGNAPGWGGLQWLYFPESSYGAAVGVVAGAISASGCTRVVIDGFSNGAAFAAKLACRGESFGGKVVGYVIDDPVPDHGTDSCARSAPAVLYWTGGLAGATPGWSCTAADWTCEGGESIGINVTAAHLGLAITPSIWNSHQAYTNPPELAAWLR